MRVALSVQNFSYFPLSSRWKKAKKRRERLVGSRRQNSSNNAASQSDDIGRRRCVGGVSRRSVFHINADCQPHFYPRLVGISIPSRFVDPDAKKNNLRRNIRQQQRQDYRDFILYLRLRTLFIWLGIFYKIKAQVRMKLTSANRSLFLTLILA